MACEENMTMLVLVHSYIAFFPGKGLCMNECYCRAPRRQLPLRFDVYVFQDRSVRRRKMQNLVPGKIIDLVLGGW
jgi:hypothetical protein